MEDTPDTGLGLRTRLQIAFVMFFGAATSVLALQSLGLGRYAAGLSGLVVLVAGAFAGLRLYVVASGYRSSRGHD